MKSINLKYVYEGTFSHEKVKDIKIDLLSKIIKIKIFSCFIQNETTKLEKYQDVLINIYDWWQVKCSICNQQTKSKNKFVALYEDLYFDEILIFDNKIDFLFIGAIQTMPYQWTELEFIKPRIIIQGN